MPNSDTKSKKPAAEDLLKDLLIATLANAGLTQLQIREIVGGDIYRVNRIAKYFKKSGRKVKEDGEAS
jgi:hypothetical protein